MQLNVLYLRSSFDPGGTETLLLNLYNHSQQKIVFHYALLKDGTLISQLKSEQNKYYKLFRRKILDYNVIRKMVYLLDDNNIIVVHSHQLIELVYALLLKIHRPGLKVFHTIHGYHDKNLYYAVERFLIRFTFKTFTVSDAAKQILCDKGYKSKKLQVLHNAVGGVIQNQTRILQIKNKLGIKPDDTIIGMTGNFVREKDQMTIIRAYNHLRVDYPKLKLIFIGKNSERTDECKRVIIKEDLNARVFFLGAVDKANELVALYDLFIMSSIAETFGIVVVESILAGIPVLASDIEPMKELSFNEHYFPLFRTGDAIDLANKLRKILNKETIHNMHKTTKNNLDFFHLRYSIKSYIDNLANIYVQE